MNRPTILVFLLYYLPGDKSGGPVRSISNMVERLGDEYNFRIVTMDRDSGDEQPYEDIRRGEWNNVGKASVRYLAPNEQNIRSIRAIFQNTEYDLVYLNSLFNPVFSLPILFLIRFGFVPRVPVVLAPRGELSPGALALKPVKKKIFLAVIKLLGLCRNVDWHATADEEKDYIGQWFGGMASVNVASNIAAPSSSDVKRQEMKEEGSLKLVFLSRIVPKKNLDGALRMLKSIKNAKVELDVYGTCNDSVYWELCLALADELSSNITFRYKGVIGHEKVSEMLRGYDLFFFPTHGENYGHVIVEAFQSGLPVLISDQTPWRNLDEKGIGWDIPLDQPELFSEVIENCYALSPKNFSKYSINASNFGKKLTEGDEAESATKKMFASLLK